MSDHTDDPRFAKLRVCREHGGLYDPAPHPENGEQQLCHGRDSQPKWVGYDFNEWVHLCDSCHQDTTSSGWRFSSFFCDTCRILIIELGPTIPKGRHSMMNSGTLPASADAAAHRLQDMFFAVDSLHFWSRARLRGLLGEGSADPYLAAVMGAARQRWDQQQAVADLLAHWRGESGSP